MRVAALVLNVVMVLFTLSVIMTDGMPANPWYQLWTYVLIAVPVVTAQTLWKARGPRALTNWERRYVGGLNVLLLVLIAGLMITQYPHPAEPGFVPFVLVICVTPLLSAWVMLRHRAAPPPTA